MFVTSDGSPYARLHRAIQARNFANITATAAELPYISLPDALGILLVIEDKDEDRFDAAAVRWAGRVALETPGLELRELAGALESLQRSPTSTPNARCSRSPNGLVLLPNGRARRGAEPAPPWRVGTRRRTGRVVFTPTRTTTAHAHRRHRRKGTRLSR